jgi:hypothetical protein
LCMCSVRLFQPDSPRQRPHNLHETCQLPCVQLITPDDGHSRCPKHVEFRDETKFWILDAPVSYLYEDYHDARSLEHKVCFSSSKLPCKAVVSIMHAT